MRTLLPTKKPRSGLLTGFATYLTHNAELSKGSLIGNALLVLLVAIGVLLAYLALLLSLKVERRSFFNFGFFRLLLMLLLVNGVIVFCFFVPVFYCRLV